MPGEDKDILKFWNGNLFQKLSFQKEVKKEDFANTALQNIFELADSDKNNVLDSSELSIFYDKVRQAAGEDSTLSEEEAVNFLSETSSDTSIKPVFLLDFFSTILTGNKAEELSSSDEIDFDSRLSDLQINQNYTRKDLTDMYGYPYQMIFDGNKLIGIISRNNVRFYTEETKGEIYSLNGVYESDFVQEGTDAPEGEFIPEKRYYRDGSIVECDKYGNTVAYDKDGKVIEKRRTETTLEGDSLDITINSKAGLKRVLNPSVEGAVYNKEGDVVYNIYSDLDSEGRVVLQTHEYADGRVVVGSSSNVLANLTVEEKSVLSKNYIARLKEDISQALQILRDYESGKGILGSTAQLFMKDGSTVDSKISYYESMLSKLNSLDGLSQEEFETAFKKIFGTDFNYNRAYSLTRINEKLSSAVRLTQTISAIDSLISADNSAALTPMDQILKSRMDSISPSSEISKFSKDFQNREFAQQAHKVLSIILGDEKLAQEYMIGVYRQAGSEEKAEQILRESLSEIKNNLNNELSTLTKGKGIEFLQKQANAVYKEAFAGDKIFSEDASALVESYMLTEAYLETGITVAVSLATMGTGAVASIGRACVSRLGARVGNLVAKTLVTALNAAVPSALTYADDATSERGITSATHAEALEEFKSGMKYGTFGTFVSGPLGNAITKFAGTKGINSLAANCIGTGIETSADVVFDRMTTDLSLKDSFMQNGGMNFAMMFLGGQIAKQLGARELEKLNKRIEQELQNIKITRNSDGTCCLSANGKVLADKVSPAYALGVMISQAKAKVETAPEVSKLGAGASEPAVVRARRLESNEQINHITKSDDGIPLSPAKIEAAENSIELSVFSKEESLRLLKECGFDDNDIAQINFNDTATQQALHLLELLPTKQLTEAPKEEISKALEEWTEAIEDGQFMHVMYFNKNNFEQLKNVFSVENANFYIDDIVDRSYNIPELYRIGKRYFDVTGEKLDLNIILRNNHNFAKDAKFPSNEQIDSAIKLYKEGFWDDCNMWPHALSLEQPKLINDELIKTMRELKNKAKAQGLELVLEYDLSPEGIEAISKLKEYEKAGNINFKEIQDKFGLYSFNVRDILFCTEIKNSGLELSNGFIATTLSCIYNASSNAMYKFAFDLINDKEFPRDQIGNVLYNTTKDNIDFARELIADKEFPRDRIANVLYSTTKYNIDFARELVADKEFPRDRIANVLSCTTKYNIDFAREMVADKEFPRDQIANVLSCTTKDNIEYARYLTNNYKQMELPANKIACLLKNDVEFSVEYSQKLSRVMGRDKVEKLSDKDFIIACKLAGVLGKTSINEIPMEDKQKFMRSLVSCNADLFNISNDMKKAFPLIPTDQESYCSLLPSIVKSLGVDIRTIEPPSRIREFNNNLEGLSNSVAKLSDNDFAQLEIKLDYPKNEFITDVLAKVKDLSPNERQKVYDYFGFELHQNMNNPTGFSIIGYPINLNNGKKLAEITDPKTKAVVESLRPDVVRFSEQNQIKCNNPEVQKLLNNIVDVLPELRTQIGKVQHKTHNYDVFQHSLKVMQKIAQDPKFATLNESDKKIMMLASLLHDITKGEGYSDKTHAAQGSFDTFFISKKFNLTPDEEIKLYTLTRHHEWLEYVNTAKSEEQLTERLQSVAYDLQHDNLFDMALMFTHADLKAVKTNDSFHDTKEGKSRIDFNGNVRSFGESANVYANRIRGYIDELKTTQPILPVTHIPKTNRINDAITQVNPDGSTNIKGVYKRPDGLVVIKFNEVEDWEAIGFPAGSVSRGYKAKSGSKAADGNFAEDVNTGNIKFFVHGLNYETQLAKFDAFSLIDSDVLLSISYAERPESKFRFFRSQGVLLDFDTKYIHGGGESDAGSGCGKFIDKFKRDYVFGGYRESDRVYVPNLIKNATGMNDAEYVKFVEANKNRPLTEIEPPEYREPIIKALASINSNTRKGGRSYNEMYGSNPKEVMGVFAYDENTPSNVGNPLEFLENTSERTNFLQKYALEHDIPFIIFGD